MITAPTQIGDPIQHTLWGVISYALEDFAWCEWLYHTVHGYPVPVTLAGSATRHGFALPHDISVFPDPNDPETEQDYAKALQTGRYLILICSPHSSHSKVLDAHIREFKRAGGEERIIALVVEGAPNSAPTVAAPTNWLPPWLAWRLDEAGHFLPADRSEPQIIDARPNRADLDDVMASLLAALMDISRSEFDVLTGPAQAPAARKSNLSSDKASVVEKVWAELAATPQAPPPETRSTPAETPAPSLTQKPIFKIAMAGAVAAVLGIAAWKLQGMNPKGQQMATATVSSKSEAANVASQSPKIASEAPVSAGQASNAASQAPVASEPPPAPPAPKPNLAVKEHPTTVAPPIAVASNPPAKTQAPAFRAEPTVSAAPSAPVTPVAPAPSTAQAAPPKPPRPAPINALSTAPMTRVETVSKGAAAPPQRVALQQPEPQPQSAASSREQPVTSIVSSGSPGNVTRLQTSIPVTPATAPAATWEQLEARESDQVLKEANRARAYADSLARQGHASEALPQYEHALDYMQRYVSLQADDETAVLDAAKLCLTVGNLQTAYSSSAEAQKTLRNGQKMLTKLKPSRLMADERARTLNALQSQIRTSR